MIPREHGAYGQLFAPLIGALAIGRPGVASWSLAVAATCTFLAHEPLLVLLGRRGTRAAREQREAAWRWLAIFTIPAIVLGAIAIVSMDSATRSTLAAPVAGAVALAVMIAIGREHTAAGEIVSAAALASLAWPVAAAGGAQSVAALTCAVVFAAGFVAATVCVHAVIDYARHPPALAERKGGAALAVVVIFALAWLASVGRLASSAPWAVSPMALAGLAIVFVPPSARRLRVVGWTLVGTTVLTTAILVATLR
jgi:YwiC-like protein